MPATQPVSSLDGPKTTDTTQIKRADNHNICPANIGLSLDNTIKACWRWLNSNQNFWPPIGGRPGFRCLPLWVGPDILWESKPKMRLQLSRKSSVKLFIGAKSRLWALIDQLLTPGLSLGGEITSDQADDYKSRLFATYQGLDDGHKREKSTPHRKN